MYAVYAFQAGATTTNINNDIVKLLTGETNKANLSADCIQGGTTITSTVAAGWTVHDAAAGTDAQVIKALNADGSTYKFLRVSTNSTTAFQLIPYEDWNATAHTGTNGAAAPATAWASASGGLIYIYATVRNAFIRFSSGGLQTYRWCFEFSRDTVASTYPCHGVNGVVTGSYFDAWLPRNKWMGTTGDISGTSSGNILGMGVATLSSASNVGWYRHSDETLRIVAHRPYVCRSGQTYGNSGWSAMGSMYDVLCTGYDVGSSLDEVSYGGKMYVIHQGAAGQPTIMIPKE